MIKLVLVDITVNLWWDYGLECCQKIQQQISVERDEKVAFVAWKVDGAFDNPNGITTNS